MLRTRFSRELWPQLVVVIGCGQQIQCSIGMVDCTPSHNVGFNSGSYRLVVVAGFSGGF